MHSNLFTLVSTMMVIKFNPQDHTFWSCSQLYMHYRMLLLLLVLLPYFIQKLIICMSMLIFSLLNLFMIHNLKSLRQLICLVIFYLQTIFHTQFIDIFIMLLRMIYHIPRYKQCQILWLMFLHSLIAQYLNGQKIKFITAQECDVTKRCLCYSLLCHSITNFILPYRTANMCWSIKQ